MITEWVSVCSSVIFMALACSPAGAVKIEPPWEKSPANGVNFTVPGIDNVPDLHGDGAHPLTGLENRQHVLINFIPAGPEEKSRPTRFFSSRKAAELGFFIDSGL